jgi:HK97 family phage major capsid protein
MNIEQIRSEVEYLDACLRDITERGQIEEQEAFDAGIAERDRLMALADRHAQIARNAQFPHLTIDPPVSTGPQVIRKTDPLDVIEDRSASRSQLADALTRSVEAQTGDVDLEHVRALAKRHGSDRTWVRQLVIRSSDVYRSAFSKLMLGAGAYLSDEERAAVAVGTAANGGVLVPTHLDPTVILSNSGSSNAVRRIARVVTLTTGNVWNGVTSAGVTASWDAELAEVSDDSPTFSAVSIPVYKAQAFVQASTEAFEDIAGLESDVLRMFADARDRLEGTAHCTGSGSSQPTGIFTALDANTNVELTSTTAATIGLVDLDTVYYNVPVRFRANSTWLMNPRYALAIKDLGTAVSASFTTDLTQGTSGTLLGRPVVESDDAPSTQTTTAKDNELVLGDFSNYVIVDKPGSTVIQPIPFLLNTSNNLPDGRSGWLMHWRGGADSVVDTAFRLLQDKTSA